MHILFVDKDLMLACTDTSVGRRRWGANCVKIIGRRLDELEAAETLYIFRPAEDPIPRKPDGGLNWAKVKSIIVLEVVDYH